MKYLSETDQKYTKLLIEAILKRGYYVGINDGEEYVVFEDPHKRFQKLTRNKEELFKSVGSTGEDSIIISKIDDSGAKRKGVFFLIYHNGDGMEVICDHTANELCEEIYNEINDEEG